ncbi:MAG: Ig-like domain-containing protein [Caldimonas sp.]
MGPLPPWIDAQRLRRSAPYALGIVLIAALYYALFGFRSAALSATVLDAETGNPLPDVTVIASWSLGQQGLGHGRIHNAIQRIEGRTDQDGVFSLPAWGPRFSASWWRMDGTSPSLFLLKPGYRVDEVNNYSSAFGGFKCDASDIAQMSSGIPTHVSAAIVASWSGCRIPLQRPTESADKVAERLAIVRRWVCEPDPGPCERAVGEFFDAERQRLRSLGVKEFHW